MSLSTNGMMSTKWQNSAARARCHAKYRAALCRILNCSTDSCYTTGELRRGARAAQQEERRSRQMEAEYDAKLERETREHYEMLDAQEEEEANRRTEFEDAGYWRMSA
jgi:hypothetical protein